MTEIEKMNLIELMEYWNKDWADKDPELAELSDPDNMKKWSHRVRLLIPDASSLTLLEALHVLEAEDIVEEQDLMLRALENHLTGDLEERIKVLEIVIKVLVDELGGKQSKISMKELMELKGVKFK